MATTSLTEEYQRLLPLALFSISPSLSALHATRAKRLNPGSPPSALHCPHCGSLNLSAKNTKRVRKAARTSTSASTLTASQLITGEEYQRILVKKCGHCGHVDHTSVATDSVASFRSVRKASKSHKEHPSVSSVPDIASHRAPPPIHDDNVVVPHALPQPIPQSAISNPSSPSPSDARHISSPAPAPTPAASTALTLPSKAKSNSKKKRSGLQEMLARNRDQKEKGAKEERKSTLSDFLVGSTKAAPGPPSVLSPQIIHTYCVVSMTVRAPNKSAWDMRSYVRTRTVRSPNRRQILLPFRPKHSPLLSYFRKQPA